MPYRFALERPDYSDLASGKVLLAAPGHPAFPVRLASEIFQRCLAAGRQNGLTGRIVLYDPCCGAAYHLAVLGILHQSAIRAIIASDIDPDIIRLAEKNLGLLSAAGIDRRREELASLYREFGKPSHAEALAAAEKLRGLIAGLPASEPLEIRVFAADALADPGASRFPADTRADIVFTDVPYGRHSQWHSATGDPPNPGWQMLDNLRARLHPASIVTIVSDKQQKIAHDGYERIERFQIGKRVAIVLKLQL